MKKDNTQWLDILKEKVESYEGEKPAASWDEMRAMMLTAGGDTTNLGNKRFSTLHNTRKWWIAAAACLAALAAGGIFLNRNQDTVLPAESIAENEDRVEVVTDGHDGAPEELLADAPAKISVLSSSVTIEETHVEIPSDTDSEPPVSAETSDSGEPGQNMNDADMEDSASDAAAEMPQDKTGAVQNASTTRQTNQFAFAEPQKKQRGGKFSVGINGQFGNGDANSSEIAAHSIVPQVPTVSKDTPYGSMTFAMAVARTEYHHAAPVSFGVSFRYDMPSGIYAESGLRFTQLLTMVTPSGAKQALLYAGIPVGLGYNLFSTGNLGVYASGYYMPAKCIAGRESTSYPTNSTNRKDVPLQHSAGISAGADYTVWNMISIYAEPTLSYYFKSENAPMTIFTENPFYLTLNLGARFNF